jgi:uncharacterized protein (TIGR03437 family)
MKDTPALVGLFDSARQVPAIIMNLGRRFKWRLAGSAILLFASVTVSSAQTFTVLANFNGTNGSSPNGVIQGVDGNLYGSSPNGGPNGAGVVFKLTLDGALTVIYPFEMNLIFGADVVGRLVQAKDGNLYGVTSAGGSSTSCTISGTVIGCGTVFRITPDGVLTTLYSFSGPDGSAPNWLIQSADGNLYGTTGAGPTITAGICTANCGTVFKLTLAGTLTTLHTFAGSDGNVPTALVEASDGTFYGVTWTGGAGTSCLGGCGTVFKLTAGGALTTLYSFGIAGFTDGWTPLSLIQGTDGNLYGATLNGGDTTNMEAITSGVGTIFRITTGGALTTLYKFNLGVGAFPHFLTQASDGNFYGTTSGGGANQIGTIFAITPGGTLTTLHSFNTADGVGETASPMIQARDGNLYGTSWGGGASNNGTVFRLTLGSTPTTTPSISQSGSVVSGASFQAGFAPNSWLTITGTNLSPVTDTWANAIVSGNLPVTLDGVSVSVSGAPAYIYYVSPTQINAIAPNVATGPAQVTVTTPAGTSAPVTATSQAEQPAFFQWGAYAVATTQSYVPAVKAGTFSGVTTTPAKPGDVIILWGTGFGPTIPVAPVGVEVPAGTTFNTANPVTVTVGGMPAVVYGAALAPGFAGLYQVAIQIPASLSNGDYPVTATVDGVPSPASTLITVQQ